MPEGGASGCRRRALWPLTLAPWATRGAAAAPVAGTLKVDFMVSSGQQRSAWVRAIEQFQQEQPAVRVVNVEFEQEHYKTLFEARMASGAADVAFWFAGERLRSAIRKGLIAPLDAPALQASLRDHISHPLLDATRVDGQIFAFPLSYYPWGFFYRKSLFQRWQVSPPATWAEFLILCERLHGLGVAPTAVGAKDGWPAAAWFDLLDMRLNGLESHRHTLASDPGLAGAPARKVLVAWQSLLRKGYFLPATTSQGWASVLPHLYRGEVAMVLLGSFAAARMPSALRGDIGFFGFPPTELPIYEVAPLDVLVVASSSQKLEAAQAFLGFLAGSTALNELNEIMGSLSPRRDAPVPSDPLQLAARQVLDRAVGYNFFFDRDVRQDWVEPAFQLFRRLMAPPHDLP